MVHVLRLEIHRFESNPSCVWLDFSCLVMSVHYYGGIKKYKSTFEQVSHFSIKLNSYLMLNKYCRMFIQWVN